MCKKTGKPDIHIIDDKDTVLFTGINYQKGNIMKKGIKTEYVPDLNTGPGTVTIRAIVTSGLKGSQEAGCITAHFKPKDRMIWIESVQVKPAYRKLGIATKLYHRAVDSLITNNGITSAITVGLHAAYQANDEEPVPVEVLKKIYMSWGFRECSSEKKDNIMNKEYTI